MGDGCKGGRGTVGFGFVDWTAEAVDGAGGGRGEGSKREVGESEA